ncbi:MAG: leucine-rich repeat domain-containing protein [Suipraeoptans sp.]
MKNCKMNKNRILTLILLFALSGCLVACGSGGSGSSDDSKGTTEKSSEDYFEWEDNIIVGLTKDGAAQKKLVIPERCEGFDALLFSQYADIESVAEEVSFESDKNIELSNVFLGSAHVKKITLPAELENIRAMEFQNCESLEAIVIPKNISAIEDYAFEGNTSLETVTFEGDMVTNIGAQAFSRCEALTDIELPDSVTTIGEYAFFECAALEVIKLPKSLSSIAGFTFAVNGIVDVYIDAETEFTSYDTTSFTQADHTVNIHVEEGSWADVNFDIVFDGAYERVYQ